MAHGGARKGSGRKKLYDEQIDRDRALLLVPAAWSCLEQAAEEGNTKAAEIILAYAYGKPQQNTDITTNGKDIQPILVKFLDDENH
jgi:hypothetical protein